MSLKKRNLKYYKTNNLAQSNSFSDGYIIYYDIKTNNVCVELGHKKHSIPVENQESSSKKIWEIYQQLENRKK